MPKDNKSLASVFFNGVINENPTFRLVLGTCPTLAVTTSAINGLGMGAAATFVLLGSNAVISLLRNFIPDKVRIPAFIVVICTFVTMVQMLMQAFVPSLYDALGMFIPLIVVNCIILARAEAFASKNRVLPSIVDGLGMGVGFTLAITVMGAIRELIGAGTVFGIQVMSSGYQPMLLIVMASGGFLTFGLYLGLFNLIVNRIEKKKKGGAAA
ncbi:MAG TPA: electron transport complex subunit E [Candidatus Excrementavichristensenella intestinipullorum]|nr:electron transport complex subunit E [Candidatus Excrementavichristensenella intestinipullorum]